MNAQFDLAPEEKGNQKRSVENVGMSMPSQVFVHAKLEMTSPGDSHEEEADEMADSIINDGKIARSVGTGYSGGGIALPSQFGSRLASMQGHGSRLYGDLKTSMENGFGRDFSNVRLHTDDAGAEMTSSISAKAFTFGNDIYFNRGQFDPGTTEGRRLVAHELTHVVQGTGRVQRQEANETSSQENPDVVNTRISQAKVLASEMIHKSIAVLDLIAGQKTVPSNKRDYVGLFFWCFGGYNDYKKGLIGKAQKNLNKRIQKVRKNYQTMLDVLSGNDKFAGEYKGRKLPEVTLKFEAKDSEAWAAYASTHTDTGDDVASMAGLATNFKLLTGRTQYTEDDNTIYLNQAHFKLDSDKYGTADQLALASTIIHELSHRVCGTDDFFNFTADDFFLDHNSEEFLENAYSYQVFAIRVRNDIQLPSESAETAETTETSDRSWNFPGEEFSLQLMNKTQYP